jgi:uncharacterized protein with PhoU and TrkA domain
VSIRGLLHIAASTEVISDAAVEISEGVLRGFSSHPVVKAAVGETDEIIVRVVVEPGSDLDGGTTGDIELNAGTGMQVLAIRRGDGREGTQGDWLLSPDSDVRLRAGDHLIAKGTRAGAERLDDLAV